MNILIKPLRFLAYTVIGLATLFLAALWLLESESNYEPIIVMLSVLSGGLLLLANYIERKTIKKTTREMSKDELLQVVDASDPKAEWQLVHSDISITAVYKSDPLLRIEHAYTEDYIHSAKFEEDWINKIPDRRAFSKYYDLYYGTTRLERFILVWVDGGRAGLPLPESSYNLSVKKIRYKIAMIFDTSDSVNQYITITGFKIQD